MSYATNNSGYSRPMMVFGIGGIVSVAVIYLLEMIF